MQQTTLATQIRDTFSRYSTFAVGASTHNDPSVLRCWRDTLELSHGVAFYEAMALVERALLNLHDQVRRSSHFDEHMRPVAVNVINGLQHCIMPELFGQNVNQSVSAQCNPERLATLGIISTVLKLDFPEPKIPDADLDKLKADVAAILQSISEADFLGDNKSLLYRQASYMAWTLANVGRLGVEPANDAIAQNLMTVERMAKDVDLKGTSPKAVLLRHWKAILVAISMVTTVATQFDTTFKALEHVEEDIRSIGK